MNLLQQLESRVREEFPGVQARLDLAEVPEASADDAALRRLRTKGGCCPQHIPARGKR